MATRAQTKAALKAATALVPVVDEGTALPATIPNDDNLPDMPGDDEIILTVAPARSNRLPMPDIENVLDIAEYGFSEKEEANNANGRATQSIAYACMALWFVWTQNGHPDPDNKNIPCPDLASVIKPEGSSARTTLSRWFREALIGERPETGSGIVLDDDSARDGNTYQTKAMLVSRAMNMAAILLSNKVDHTMFNTTEHYFEVDPALLIPSGHRPLPGGRLSRGLATIPLDRQSLALTRITEGKDDGFVKIYASVEQLDKASRDRMGLVSSRSGRKAKALKDRTPQELKAQCSLPTLIEALHGKFVAMKGKGKLLFGDLTPELWGMLADIQAQNEQYQESESFRAFRAAGLTSNAKTETETKSA